MSGITIPSCCVYPTWFASARKTTGTDQATFRLSTTDKVVSSSMTSDWYHINSSSINDETGFAASEQCGDFATTPYDEVASTDPGSGESSTVSGSDISDAGGNSDSEGLDESSFVFAFDDSGISTSTSYSVSQLLQIRETLGTCAPIISYSAWSANDLSTDFLVVKDACTPSTNGLSNKAGVANSTQIAALPPWKKKRHLVTNENAKDAEIARILRAILNKLTMERFEVLYEKIADCCMKHPQHLGILVREIFDTATTQHNFIGMYVDLCLRVEGDPRLKLASGCKIKTFKRLLLNQCQHSFEELLTMESSDFANTENIDEDDLEERRLRRKHRALGNIKLIGQLLVHGMLSSKFLVVCCEELLGRRKECTEALEALSTLLTVTGPTFDTRPDWPWRPRLEAVFSMIRDLVSKKNHVEVTPRMRFLLRDLLDLQAAVWNDSKQATTGVKGPKPLKEIQPINNPLHELCKIARKQECAPSCLQDLGRQRNATQRYGAMQLVPSNNATSVTTAITADELSITKGAERSTNNTPKVRVACNPTQAHVHLPMKCKKSNKAHNRKDGYMNAIATMDVDKENAAPEVVPHSLPALLESKRGHTINPLKACDATFVATKESLVTDPRPFQPNPMVLQAHTFNLRTFRYEITAILKDLASNHDVAGAIHRIRVQQVPRRQQAIEFADILTRIAEETRGPARRVAFAFLANLADSKNDVFDKTECVNGIKLFFDEIYEGLCAEVPRLPAIVSTELLPILRSVFSVIELGSVNLNNECVIDLADVGNITCTTSTSL